MMKNNQMEGKALQSKEYTSKKKLPIKPFREFWLNCFDCIVNSVFLYVDVAPKNYLYQNNYMYTLVNQDELEKSYQSIQPVPDYKEIFRVLPISEDVRHMGLEEDPIGFIKQCIDEEKIILLGIDLFYWINEGLHYQHHHIYHYSLVIGYDDELQQLNVLDTGDDLFAEFQVDYNQAILAIKSYEGISKIFDINPNASLSMYTMEDLKNNARRIVQSIDYLFENKKYIWNVEEFSDEQIVGVISIVQTHLFTLQNREKVNRLLFQNSFRTCKLHNINYSETFYDMELKFEELKGKCIKQMHAHNKKEGLENIKNRVFELLDEERNLWKYFLESGDEMELIR